MEYEERKKRMLQIFKELREIVSLKYGQDDYVNVVAALSLLYAWTAFFNGLSKELSVQFVNRAYDVAVEDNKK